MRIFWPKLKHLSFIIVNITWAYKFANNFIPGVLLDRLRVGKSCWQNRVVISKKGEINFGDNLFAPLMDGSLMPPR